MREYRRAAAAARAIAWAGTRALAGLVVPSCTALSQEPSLLPPIRGLDEFVAAPAENPLRVDVLLLGRQLFFDPILSRNGQVSCASCHSPQRSFADSTARSAGVSGRRGRRNAPAIVNRGYGAAFFWDGRAATLEEQVLGPLQNPNELGSSVSATIARLAADSSYAAQFREAFGAAPTGTTLARALASYLRSIRSGDSRFDRFTGGDAAALSAQEQWGLALFRGRAGCWRCHTGANLTDEDFHNTGVAAESGDPGRESVTRRPGDRGRFKTPTLRDVARTAPYMHDGNLQTLEAVIEFYDGGGRPNPLLDPDVRPLRLTSQEKSALVAFLRALTASAVSCAPIACVPECTPPVSAGPAPAGGTRRASACGRGAMAPTPAPAGASPARTTSPPR